MFDEPDMPIRLTLTWYNMNVSEKIYLNQKNKYYGAFQHTLRSTVQSIAVCSKLMPIVEQNTIIGNYYDRAFENA